MTRRTPVPYRLLLSLCGIAACLAVAAPPAFSEDATAGAEKPAAAPAGTGGMTVYVDPQTGALLNEPAPGTQPLQLNARDQNAMSTKNSDLVQIPSSEPGGGVKLDLQGRFQSPFVATVGPDGKVTARHFGEAPGSHLGEAPDSHDHK